MTLNEERGHYDALHVFLSYMLENKLWIIQIRKIANFLFWFYTLRAKRYAFQVIAYVSLHLSRITIIEFVDHLPWGSSKISQKVYWILTFDFGTLPHTKPWDHEFWQICGDKEFCSPRGVPIHLLNKQFDTLQRLRLWWTLCDRCRPIFSCQRNSQDIGKVFL